MAGSGPADESSNLSRATILQSVIYTNLPRVSLISPLFFFHLPYGKAAMYREALKTASLEKLTKLINIVALLLQTKVYLFWENA